MAVAPQPGTLQAAGRVQAAPSPAMLCLATACKGVCWRETCGMPGMVCRWTSKPLTDAFTTKQAASQWLECPAGAAASTCQAALLGGNWHADT